MVKFMITPYHLSTNHVRSCCMGICCMVVVFLVKKNKKNFRTEQFLTIAGDVFLYLTPLLIHMRLHGLTGRFYTSVIPKSQVQTSSGPSSVIGLYDLN